jgi:Protein of unknown function (DUF3995)
MTAFFAVSLLHAYWAMGGRWARDVAVPEALGKPVFKPGRGATFVVAFLLLAAAAVVALNADFWTLPGLPRKVATVGGWSLSTVMLARFVGDFRYIGVFKRIRGTRFARLDTTIYAPLCLALGIGSAIVTVVRPA